jgi:glutamate 5-kinase
MGVRGSFEAGDTVKIVTGSEEVGKGITSYSSREVAGVKGKKSDAVRELLTHLPDEVIHRDRFVLL